MGYDIEFTGSVKIDPPLNASEVEYLEQFARSRRMQREQGPYCVLHSLNGVTNENQPPAGQPGLWCDWEPQDVDEETGATDTIAWSGGEKFDASTDWMRYLIDHFLKPGAMAENHQDADRRFKHFTFDHMVNGVIEALDEDGDRWRILVKDNVVTEQQAAISWAEDD